MNYFKTKDYERKREQILKKAREVREQYYEAYSANRKAYYEKNKEKIKENAKQYYKENLERCKEYAAQYRKEHYDPEIRRAQYLKQKAKHPKPPKPEKTDEEIMAMFEKRKAYLKRYYQENREYILALDKARRKLNSEEYALFLQQVRTIREQHREEKNKRLTNNHGTQESNS